MPVHQIIVDIDRSKLARVRRSMGIDPRLPLEYLEADASLAGMEGILGYGWGDPVEGIALFDNWIIRQAEKSHWSVAAVKADVLTTLAHEHRHHCQRRWAGFARPLRARTYYQCRGQREDRIRFSCAVFALTIALWPVFLLSLVGSMWIGPLAGLSVWLCISRPFVFSWLAIARGWYWALQQRWHPDMAELDAETFAQRAAGRADWQSVVDVTISLVEGRRPQVVFFDR